MANDTSFLSQTEATANYDATAVTKTPRLKIQVHDHVQTTPKTRCTTMASTPMSTCSTATNTTASTMTTDVNSYYSTNLEGNTLTQGQSTPSSTTTASTSLSTHSIRVPKPSPTRNRLDRQYAKRLAASSAYFQTPTARSPVSESLDCDPMAVFRPTPILSIDTTRSHETPGSFFFPTTPPARRETSFSSTSTAVSSNSNNSSNSNSNNTTISSSRRRRNSSLSSATDMGVSDRFIPSRATSNMNNLNLWDSKESSRPNRYYTMPAEDSAGTDTNTNTNATNDDTDNTGGSVNPATGRVNETSSITRHQQNLHNVLLRSELLGENISPYAVSQAQSTSRQTGAPLRDGMNRLRFQSPRQAYRDTLYNSGATSVVNSFSLTPFGTASSQQLMSAPQKHRRKIAKVPFKVLDAPALQDDFYLNLVDWSSQNVLAVGLGSCVYLWSACTSKVTKLCDLAQAEDLVTSVSWAQRGTHLAVGTNKGEVQLWDTIKVKKVRTMQGHTARVGTLAWTGPTLASGSRDRLIFLRDVREKSPYTHKLNAHRQEVCGLKWSFDEPAFLASGGNDNQLHVVDSRNPGQPIHRFTDHTAAVKAIAWSPHQHGLLASGGGTADRCIRFWNTLSGSALNCVDTGSQVCNLAWSQNCNEIVSTHGYSLNQIVVWRYPSLSKVVTLTGHTYRVLYLAMSPDGSTIVTGAGDETLRFWQVFPGPRSDSKNNAGGLLFPNTLGSVIR